MSSGNGTTDERIAAALAQKLGTDQAGLWVDVAEVEVPGLVLFGSSGPVGRRSWAGVFDGDGVELDREVAMGRVLAAWRYGPERTRPARDVAAAAGLLEGQPGLPYVDEQAIEDGGRPEGVTTPTEVEVDGLPGVRYWNSSSRRRLWLSTIIAHPDHRAEFRGADDQ